MKLGKQMLIFRLLKKHEYMFDGTLGNYTGSKYKIELIAGAQPYHIKLFPIPKVHEETLKTEVIRLVHKGVLKRKNNSEWAAPTLITTKRIEQFVLILILKNLIKELRGNHFLFLKQKI